LIDKAYLRVLDSSADDVTGYFARQRLLNRVSAQAAQMTTR
jgi:hypothetical protein